MLIDAEASRARRVRHERLGDLAMPVSPVAHVVVDRAVATLRTQPDLAVRNAMEALLDGVGALGSEDERLAGLVVARFTLAFEAGEEPDLQVNVLWDASRNAIRADDEMAILAIRARLTELAHGDDRATRYKAVVFRRLDRRLRDVVSSALGARHLHMAVC